MPKEQIRHLGLIAITALCVQLVCVQLVQSETGYFWHLADFHLDPNFTAPASADKAINPNLKSPDHRDYFLGDYEYEICWQEGAAGIYGDYDCDAPGILIQSAMEFVKNYQKKADFIIWTGDDTSHAEDEHFSVSSVLDIIQTITNYLNTTGITVYPVLGNHDMSPKNQLPVDVSNPIYADTAEMWRHWLPPSSYEEYKANGGFYHVSSSDTGLPFQLIGLNTNLFYKSNHETEDIYDPLGQLWWLENMLSSAQDNGEKVLLFAHVPPGKFERFYQYYVEIGEHGFPWFSNRFNDAYLAILDRYSSVLLPQIYAHHHTDSWKMFGDAEGNHTSFGFLGPSITPWRSTLAPETGANNPSLRLFHYDTESGQILDYDQFWLNLTLANENSSPTWELEYSLCAYYADQLDCPPSVEGMAALLENVHSDEAVFAKYYAANTVQFEQATPETCDSVCHEFHYCAMREQRYDRFEACVETVVSTTTASPPVTTGTAASSRAASDLVVFVAFLCLLFSVRIL